MASLVTTISEETAEVAEVSESVAAAAAMPSGAAGFSLTRLAVIFAGGNLISIVCRTASGLLTARFVGPAVLGLFNGLSLVQGYLPFAQLGVLNGLSRELPFFMGRNEPERARSLTAAADAWAILIGGGAAIVLAGLAIWYGFAGRMDLAVGWASNALCAFLLIYAELYLQTTYRSGGDFARVSVARIISAVASVLFVAAVWQYGYYGVCIRAVAVAVTSAVALWWWRPMRVRPHWNWREVVHLLKIGFPIFASGRIWALWLVLNSTLVLRFTGTKGLGFFALAGIVSTATEILPLSMTQILFPQMAERYGRTSDLAGAVQLIVKPTAVMVALMLPFVVGGWWLLGPVVSIVLPKYAGGVEAAKWMLLASSVLSLNAINNTFQVARRQDLYIGAIGVGVVAYAALLFALTRHGVYLAAFTQALAGGYVATMIASTGLVASLVRKTRA